MGHFQKPTLLLLNEEQKGYIKAFLDEIETKKEKYETHVLWLLDQKIGGIGGYCMPPDPKKNPFPGGLERELFRPVKKHVQKSNRLIDKIKRLFKL